MPIALREETLDLRCHSHAGQGEAEAEGQEDIARKQATQVSQVPVEAGAKARPGAREAKPIKMRRGEKVVLLSGGNPQIAKADGNAPVQVYIAAMPGWKRDLGRWWRSTTPRKD